MHHYLREVKSQHIHKLLLTSMMNVGITTFIVTEALQRSYHSPAYIVLLEKLESSSGSIDVNSMLLSM